MSRTESIVGQHQIDIGAINHHVEAIAKKFQPEKIMLFGSYASGSHAPHSDVDLLVIMDTEQSTWDLAVEISLEVKHSFPMDIVVRTPKEIARRLRLGDFFIQSVMENGKVLYERTD